MTGPESVEVDFIAPRHLAGGGDPAWITVPLHRAAGWSYGDDPLMPRVILSSPGLKALLKLEPTADGQWWILHHASAAGRPAWHATFGGRTPVEAIAGFTDALTHPHTASAHPDPYGPLLAEGWLPGRDHDGLTSPDGFARVEHFTEGSADSWFVTTAIGEDPEGQLWQARFSGATPLPLIAGFTRALADPTPLARDLLDLSPLARARAQVTVREIPSAERAFALEHRVQQLTVPSSDALEASPRAPRVPPPPRHTR
ncbi:DUF317 domain-containing protein [Streptomyces sp. NPDC020965]|uniref:DUF317 domain-containing protein n=1 Tax=Streptomyces sp. NPDC020965 TaxID=3365105 RepID=UPI0037B3AEFD